MVYLTLCDPPVGPNSKAQPQNLLCLAQILISTAWDRRVPALPFGNLTCLWKMVIYSGFAH